MPDKEKKLRVKREKRNKISYSSMFVALLLLALIVPFKEAQATQEGSITVKKFRVEDYENLRESTGQSSDMTNVPTGAQTIAGVEFTLEKLLVGSTDTNVTPSTPIDTSFPKRRQTTDIQGETIFTNLPEGYYLITETILPGHTAHNEGKFVVKIPNMIRDAQGNETISYDVVVYPKGERITVEKTVSSTKQVVGLGDIITWDVWYPLGPDLKKEVMVGTVPTTLYGKNFYLTDEMDSRLDYVEDSAVFRYYDRDENEIGLTLTQGVDYHLLYDIDSHVLTIAFTDDVGTKKVADANVAYIGMTLSTRVNASALDSVIPLWNNARISFENASGDPYEHEVFPPGTDPEDNRVPKVYLGQIAVKKVDAQNKEMRLAGATFSLAESEQDAQAGRFLTREIDESGTREEITITTDSNGEAIIKAIGAGSYYLVETKAPEGYHQLTEPIEVTIANDGRANVVEVEVSNLKEGSTPGDGDPGDNEPGDPTGGGPGTGDGPGGKDFAGGVKTGDVVRMTGILLLTIASGGIMLGILRKREEKKQEAQGC